jgi:homoserine kinase type II
MAAVTVLEPQELEELLSRYDVGLLERFWPAANGIENTNYFLRLSTPEGCRELVLTLLERPSAAGSLIVPLLDLCERAGLPVAPILRNRAGAPIDRVNGRETLLAPRLHGRHVLNPTVRQCAAVGRFLARFHDVAAALADEAPAYPRGAEWLRQHAELARGFVPHADHALLMDVVASVSSMLARDDVKALPRGVIHGDLFRDNVLFTERGLSGVLDFHHASAGYLVYDLAVAANDWCNDCDGVLDAERTIALMRAYHRIRPLTGPELWHFPMFALYAGTAFWLSRLTVALSRESADLLKFKNPDEFKRIVERHATHLFHVDARILA